MYIQIVTAVVISVILRNKGFIIIIIIIIEQNKINKIDYNSFPSLYLHHL